MLKTLAQGPWTPTQGSRETNPIFPMFPVPGGAAPGWTREFPWPLPRLEHCLPATLLWSPGGSCRLWQLSAHWRAEPPSRPLPQQQLGSGMLEGTGVGRTHQCLAIAHRGLGDLEQGPQGLGRGGLLGAT